MTTPTPATPALLSDECCNRCINSLVDSAHADGAFNRKLSLGTHMLEQVLRAHIAAQAAEIQALRERVEKAERWQPIETAPMDGSEFQAWIRSAHFATGWWEPRCRFNADGAFQVWQRVDYDQDGFDMVPDAAPTHWKMQPAAPAAIAKGAQS